MVYPLNNMVRFLSIFLLTLVIAEAEPKVAFGTGLIGEEIRKEVIYSDEVAGRPVKVVVRQANYDFSGHKISGGENIEGDQPPADFQPATIDGVEIAGTDGINPFAGAGEGKMVCETIRDIELKWDGKDIDVPRALHINLLGLELAGDYGGADSIQFVPSSKGDALLIQLTGGDGGGRYLVSLILRKSGKHQQIYHGYWEETLPPKAKAWELVEAKKQ
ncbi:MAG: hypothetical protein AB8D78_15210 [Akkermansiaceae bacterium]